MAALVVFCAVKWSQPACLKAGPVVSCCCTRCCLLTGYVAAVQGAFASLVTPSCFLAALQVGMRIVGTTAGTSIAHGVLSNPVLAAHPALLILLMAGFAMVLAPLASPSFHLRLTTALILISACVTIVCQYSLDLNSAQANVAYLVTRIMEVRIG